MTSKVRNAASDAFRYFIKSSENFLDFLVCKYSFSKAAPGFAPPECWIEYKKDNVVLNVIYEYGDYPWIRLSLNGKDDSLDNFMKKNWHEQPIHRRKGPSDPNERVDFALKSYSGVLQQHINELL